MNIEIKVPSLGESIFSAIISAIMKPSGSYVKEGEEILELETDKVNQVLYAPASGILTLSVKVEDKVEIGQKIGFVDTSAKAPAEVPKAPKPEPKKPEAQKPAPEPKPISQPSTFSSRKLTSDFALETKAPPSPKYTPPTERPATLKPGVTRKRMSGLRRTIAEKLVAVKNQTAMLTTFNEVDMSKVIEIRAKEKESFEERYGTRLGFMSFFVKASVAGLKQYSNVGAYLDGDEIVSSSIYDIGIAVSTEKGLFVPVLRDCENHSFGQIEIELVHLAKKAREGKISIEELRGGVFTITNAGVYGSLISTPILNPPQSAVLGMHNIVKRPVVVNDQIVIRPMMYLALSYDHRVVDGEEAVKFLMHVKQSLEEPARLLLDL